MVVGARNLTMKNGIVWGTSLVLAMLPAWSQDQTESGTFQDLATALASPETVKILEIKEGDPDIDRIGELRKCVSLEKLVLHHCGLREFPDLSNLPWLTHLDVSFNEFDQVPETITNLSGLKSFAMFENQLERLPKSIGKMKSLKHLFLGKNPNLDIEDAIDKLKPLQKLENLGFGGIAMTSLPEAIGELNGLTLLWIANTGLRSLPDSLSKLKNLETLVLSGCKFDRLPNVVERLSQLKTIVLTDNPMNDDEIDRIEALLPDLKITR